jgi:hypothetical protein
MTRISRLLMAIAFVTVAASPASACTEALFRVGKGVHYREYQAPIPGNILMVARTQSERLMAEWLAHTGHNVQVVENPDHLASYLKKDKFDVILAHFDDRDVVAAQERSAGSSAKYVPVANQAAGEQAAAQAQFRQVLGSDSSPRDILKAIHRTLKSDTNMKTTS